MAGEQTFGALLDAALDLDRSWMEYGACREWARERARRRARERTKDYGPTPWQVSSRSDPVNGVPADKLADLALVYCAGCLVRYDCARYAVEGRMIAGTWAMRIKLLLWLQKQPDALDLITRAENEAAEVQVFVRQVMRERTGKE